MGLLLVAGLALSFTPCVLPMLPILLGIITNQHQVSKTRAAVLSSAYALGVATMMAVFGLVVAKTGINIQIVFQKPVWLIIFALLFILMGLAMLGVFSVAMPNSVQNKVFIWQNKFREATAGNLFVVGALSTLIVGPCIAPPLIAVLAGYFCDCRYNCTQNRCIFPIGHSFVCLIDVRCWLVVAISITSRCTEFSAVGCIHVSSCLVVWL